MKKNRKKKGFTLIELIVVIAILGILALVAIPKFSGTLSNAKLRSHNSNISILKSAASTYLAENGNPGSKVTWNAANNYVDTWPTDPWGRTPAQTYSVSIETDGSISVTGVTAP